MSEKNTCLTVKDLLQGEYKIPLYQRNFAWAYDEIEQLIVDVADACKEKKNAYYIGTLVVDSGNNIIDGQQRTTALTLIALALKKYDKNKIHLTFAARKQSNKTLAKLLEYASNSNEELKEVKTSHDFESDELTIGFDNAIKALKKVLDDDKKLDREIFADYLFNNVKIFQTQLSSDLDLNLYFERFNSRGEQLQAHEIIKAQMMDVLRDNAEETQKFAKIWEACSQMDKAVILSFNHKSRPNDDNLEREKIFSKNYNDYQLKNIYNSMESKEIGRQKLVDYLNSDKPKAEGSQEKDLTTYRPLINFETFLYYVFYLTEGIESNEITLDDKKLLVTFEQKLNALNDDTKHDWVIKFSENLLRLRFIFDNFIIQNSFEDNNRDETNWTLKKAVRKDKNGGWKYVQTEFQNTFDNNQGTIIQLQSMFAVTFTSNRDTKWLYETMSFLFKNSSQLGNDIFSVEFKYFLEKLAVKFAEERIFIDHEIKSYQESVPVYAFNFIDYILWTKRDEEQFKKVFSDAKNFKFRYRQSIEHWYPQNPNEEDTNLKKLDDNYLHSIGNLCLITQSQNSKFSNSRPQAKAKWKDDFSTQSLKLQWMKYITDKEQQWSKKQIDKMSKEVNQYVNDFIDSVSKS
ncbi:Uncharacterized conserved protein [Streptococcus equinus]|uniref:DUF262 domain-containing protein n=1 Tax=Streptococcus equinus TaxID=1335 RepID=UPI000F6C4333|nr:DUF262 domain-containing protein [Streptococcus equinus]VEE22093.1 Uncharacterized conserved protein [Streptococcus equinus]